MVAHVNDGSYITSPSLRLPNDNKNDYTVKQTDTKLLDQFPILGDVCMWVFPIEG